MAFFRQHVGPFLIFLVFLLSLLAVSARIFLPADMAAPAPISFQLESPSPLPATAPAQQVAGLTPNLEKLVKGLPGDLPLEQF